MRLSQKQMRVGVRWVGALLLFAAAALTGCDARTTPADEAGMPQLLKNTASGAEASSFGAAGTRGSFAFRHHVRVDEPAQATLTTVNTRRGVGAGM